MAAAEARAAWQRMANRCFVQEDAKRAPKLACCPPSSIVQDCVSNSGVAANGTCHAGSKFLPLNWNLTNSNLPPETKRWLQQQPNFGPQKKFTTEQPNALGDDIKDKTRRTFEPSSRLAGDLQPGANTDLELDRNTPLESSWIEPSTFMKQGSETMAEELKEEKSNSQHPNCNNVEVVENMNKGSDLMDWMGFSELISPKKDSTCFGLEPHWVKGEKNQPWWQVADKDELESLVVQKSLDHIENCDLPRPHKVHISRDPYASLGSFDDVGLFSAYFDQNLHAGVCSRVDYAPPSSTSMSLYEKYWSSSEIGLSLYDTESRYRGIQEYKTTTKDPEERSHDSHRDPIRAQLSEALCHSQTRAREAEIAAQQAYKEKEDIVKLFFQQASVLFAYKQWLRLLHLESLLLQLKIKDHHISTLLPALPCMRLKGKQIGKDVHEKCGICRYVVAVAVGLSLVSAGLLLGWTLGWLLSMG